MICLSAVIIVSLKTNSRELYPGIALWFTLAMQDVKWKEGTNFSLKRNIVIMLYFNTSYLTLEAGLLGLLGQEGCDVSGVGEAWEVARDPLGGIMGIRRFVLWINRLMSESEYSLDPWIACSILSVLSCKRSCCAMGFVSPNLKNCWRIRGSSSRVGMLQRSKTWPRVS